MLLGSQANFHMQFHWKKIDDLKQVTEIVETLDAHHGIYMLK